VTIAELERIAEKAIAERGSSSFDGYDPHGLPRYPAVLCVSVNEEIVHGIPGPRVVEEGDIVSLDFGVSVDGFHGDAAVTVPVGRVDERTQRLLAVTRESLWCGIQAMRPGRACRTSAGCGQVGGFSVVRDSRTRHRTQAASALDSELRAGRGRGCCRGWCS
jgi:methionyl aminopeptidase